jgi:hypothetical protein
MSYTKLTFKDNIMKPVNEIQEETLIDNDLTAIFKYLNASIDIRDSLHEIDKEIGGLWNEIIFDLIASIHSAASGFYRSGIVTLRSILEIGACSFYYLDHKVEFSIFQNTNSKADKYVSTLINNHDFFKTKYAKTFFGNIEEIETNSDSISEFLGRQYGVLSDVVHGRYKSLIKLENLDIGYKKKDYKKYESLLLHTLSILAVMYVIRINDFSNEEIIDLANICKVVRL